MATVNDIFLNGIISYRTIIGDYSDQMYFELAEVSRDDREKYGLTAENFQPFYVNSINWSRVMDRRIKRWITAAFDTFTAAPLSTVASYEDNLIATNSDGVGLFVSPIDRYVEGIPSSMSPFINRINISDPDTVTYDTEQIDGKQGKITLTYGLQWRQLQQKTSQVSGSNRVTIARDLAQEYASHFALWTYTDFANNSAVDNGFGVIKTTGIEDSASTVLYGYEYLSRLDMEVAYYQFVEETSNIQGQFITNANTTDKIIYSLE